MSRSLNKVMLIGNLGNDPEVRETSNGGKVASFSLATSRSWGGQGAEKKEKTEWHKCVAWNGRTGGTGLADIIERYCKKGEKLYVEGSIEYRQFQDKEGQTRYVTEINVREIMLLGGKGGGDFDGGSAPRARSASPSSAPARGAAPSAPAGDFEEYPGALEAEDDLPF